MLTIGRGLIEYNRAINAKIHSICDPLLKCLGLQCVYIKVYLPSYEYMLLSCDDEFIADYLTWIKQSSIFSEDKHITYGEKELAFTCWPQQPYSVSMDIYMKHNMWNGFTIAKKHKDFIELWGFSTHPNNTFATPAFYLKHKEILAKFADHFSIKIQDIVSKSGEPDLPKLNDGYKYSHVFNGINHNEQIMEKLLMEIIDPNFKNLSLQERQCLHLLAKGNTIKLAARRLTISPRTVEEYINRAKHKLNCDTKIELLNRYYKLGFNA